MASDALPMTADSEFTYKKLPQSARQHIRIFQTHQFLDRFAMGLTVAVVALALVDRGMSLFQISVLFGVYSALTMTMELPFGGLSDAVGRKPVFLAAVIASLFSLLLFVSSNQFYVLALSFAFIGLGRALRSGTLDAWFLETFRQQAPNIDVQPALARAQSANALGLACGAIIGGLLPDVFGSTAKKLGFSVYDTSYIASIAVMIVVFCVTLFAISEPRRSPEPRALIKGFTSVPGIVKEAGTITVKHPVLSALLFALALFLMATNPVEVLWPTHVKPMLAASLANTSIGALTATYFFSIALGASLSPRISRMFNRQQGVTLTVVFAALAAVQIILALQGSVPGFVAMFILFAVLLGASETPASSILHACVADHQRSTLLSLRSLIQQLGAAIGLVLAGALADLYTTPVAWMCGAVFLIIALVLTHRMAKRM